MSAEVKVWTNVQGFSEYLEEKGYETAVIATKVRSPIREKSEQIVNPNFFLKKAA